jgi:hypothetical protein
MRRAETVSDFAKSAKLSVCVGLTCLFSEQIADELVCLSRGVGKDGKLGVESCHSRRQQILEGIG